MRVVISGLILIGLLLLSPVKRSAGQNEFTWVYTGNFLADFYWSPDSRVLVFGEDTTGRVETTNGQWNSYDVETEEFLMSTRWPLQPLLKVEEEAVFKIAGNETITSYIFKSSDGRFLIYGQAEDSPRSPAPLALSSRETLETHVEPESILDPFHGTDNFWIMWAGDDSTFVVRNARSGNSSFPLLFYASDFSEDVHDARFILLDKVVLESTEYYVREVLDISDTGDLLLLDTAVSHPETHRLMEHHLILWNIHDAASSVDIGAWENETYAGAFCPSGEERVVYMSGLDLYEQEIGGSERVHLTRYAIFEEHLHNHVSRRSPLTVLFSPDAHYIMLHPEDPGKIQSDLYLADLIEKDFDESQCFIEN